SFGPERGLELMSGQNFEVVGEIKPGRAVQDAAVLLNEFDELHLTQVLRSLKHQVFEKVGKPGAVPWLDAEPDVVVDGDGHGRGRPVFSEHDFQTVRELIIG